MNPLTSMTRMSVDLIKKIAGQANDLICGPLSGWKMEPSSCINYFASHCIGYSRNYLKLDIKLNYITPYP